MNGQGRFWLCNSHQQFRLRFKKRLRQLLDCYGTRAEAFGPAWEATLQEVPLSEAKQVEVYWQLIDWARSEELFTGGGEAALLLSGEGYAYPTVC
jgi:hypothetical protein